MKKQYTFIIKYDGMMKKVVTINGKDWNDMLSVKESLENSVANHLLKGNCKTAEIHVFYNSVYSFYNTYHKKHCFSSMEYGPHDYVVVVFPELDSRFIVKRDR